MKIIWKVIILGLVLCLLLGFVLSIPMKSECDLDSLLLHDEMIPVEWKKMWRVLPPALPLEGALDALEVDYEYGKDIAAHTIYQYKNPLVAFLFLRINRQVYNPTSGWKWFNLTESKDWSLNGDEQRVMCGKSGDTFLSDRCSAVVRYGLFISVFSSPIGEGIMNQEEFKAIVLAIDDQIAACIQQPKK